MASFNNLLYSTAKMLLFNNLDSRTSICQICSDIMSKDISEAPSKRSIES